MRTKKQARHSNRRISFEDAIVQRARRSRPHAHRKTHHEEVPTVELNPGPSIMRYTDVGSGS